MSLPSQGPDASQVHIGLLEVAGQPDRWAWVDEQMKCAHDNRESPRHIRRAWPSTKALNWHSQAVTGWAGRLHPTL
jgi:hypothetical protein